MISIDKDGLTLCNIQGNIFEKSLEYTSSSSLIFIRRFMNSDIALSMDNISFLNDTLTINNVFELIDDEYGKSNYGKIKYNKDSLYWIGYIYRYFSYTYKLSSKQVYKIVKPNELNQMYFIYHTFDCKNAIERILEEKNIKFDNSNERLLKLLKFQRYMDNMKIEVMTTRYAYSLYKDYEYNTSFHNQDEYEKYLYDANNVESYIDNYKNKGYILIAIIYNDEVIGEIRYKDIDSDTKELSIMLKNSYSMNKGLGSVALRKGLEYARNVIKIKNINVKIYKNDAKSIHIFENLGFKYMNESDDLIYFYKVI